MSRLNKDQLKQELELLKEEQEYQQCEKYFRKFFRKSWSIFDPADFVTNWHIDCLAEHVQAAYERKIRRLIINVPPRCLEENTEILLWNGTEKKIKDICIGDTVKSFDIRLKHSMPGLVTDFISSGYRRVWKVTTSQGRTLEATDNHRLYTEEGYRYVDKDLIGINLSVEYGEDAYGYDRVVSVDYIGVKRTYDITVDQYENFTLANGIHSHNSGKSTMTSIASPAWGWVRDSKEKIWLISHSLELVDQNISGVKTIVKSDWYSNRWCDAEDDYNYRFSYGAEGLLDTRKRFENTDGGYLIGGSPGSKTLGKGYTVAILDDILDSAESYNQVMVEKVNNWYKTTFRNRSNNKSNDVVIIVMQRLSEADICAYVEETYPDEDWFKLIIPARYDPKLTFTSPLGSKWNDHRSKPNQLLDPVRLPEDFLFGEEKDLILFNTRYQQNPQGIGEGNLVKKEELDRNRIVTRSSTYDFMLTVWDLNTTDSPTSTYTVGAVLGLTSEGTIELIDMYREISDITKQEAKVHELKKKYPQSAIGVEAKANGAAILTKMKAPYPEHEVIEFNPKLYGGSKLQRYAACVSTIVTNKFKIYDPRPNDPFLEDSYDVETIIEELYKFPLSKYNDIVDAIAYGLLYLDQIDVTQMLIVTGGKKIEMAKHLGTINLSQLEQAAYQAQVEDTNAIYSNLPTLKDLMEIF